MCYLLTKFPAKYKKKIYRKRNPKLITAPIQMKTFKSVDVTDQTRIHPEII
jgi:hypothetical protein